MHFMVVSVGQASPIELGGEEKEQHRAHHMTTTTPSHDHHMTVT